MLGYMTVYCSFLTIGFEQVYMTASLMTSENPPIHTITSIPTSSSFEQPVSVADQLVVANISKKSIPPTSTVQPIVPSFTLSNKKPAYLTS